MNSDLFRKTALDKLSSPERLNEYIKITNPGVWSVLLACLALLVAVGFWAFYGNIPDTVHAFGIIFPEHGVTQVIPTAGGRISNMRVQVGDYVEAGQILAVIPQEDLIRRINEARSAPEPDQDEISKLMAEYESRSLVLSPVSGIVLSARRTDETITAAEVIASIVKMEQFADKQQVIGYVPVSAAQKLKEGMEVQVSPEFAPREEYGFVYGRITRIGAYPVSEADVLAAVGNMQYAQRLFPRENSVEVRVTLTVDPNSPNGVKWSNENGKQLPLALGTYCRLQIVVQNYKPFELMF
ncbi:MAG TPA: HlyD family efflux transporter periplasmic adaptor subunit [Firmicutes bacterium]|nr:HlyD family efflux transporter periplasmic adaptor subunit [Bacillota bacterium]